MSIIQLRPQPAGRWKVFESPGVEPVFPDREGALSYAESRMRARLGEIHHRSFTSSFSRADLPISLVTAVIFGQPLRCEGGSQRQ